MITTSQRAAARADNPNRVRLDEIDEQLDTIAADAAAHAKEAQSRRWALMKERAGLTNDAEKGLNLLSYLADHTAARERAKAMTTNELCVYLMEHIPDVSIEAETVLDEAFERLGYVYEEGQP